MTDVSISHRTRLGVDAKLTIAFLAGTLVVSLLLLLYFHNRFWFTRDDGYYAHIADRILSGDLLHRDVQALHPGGVYYLNALAMDIFGRNFLSLRYPLVGAGLLQTLLVFLILRPRGLAIAATAGVLCATLTIVQFFSPTAHWYCPPLALGIVLLLTPGYRDLRWRIEMIGFLLVTLFWFRQLTAVFVAIGAVSWLLLEARPQASSKSILGRAVIAVMAAGIGIYLWGKADVVSFLLFGYAPLLILVLAAVRLKIDERQATWMISRLAMGGAVATFPVLIYHLSVGTAGDWFRDVFLDAVALGEFAYQKTARFGPFLVRSIENFATWRNSTAAINGLYWLALMTAPLVLASTVIICFVRRGFTADTVAPLPFMAVFYGLIAVHYQDPAYLYYAAGPIFAGLLWTAASWRAALIAASLAMAAIALHFHAGQPISRGYADLIDGVRHETRPSSIPALDGLYVTSSDEATFAELIRVIDRYSRPGDPLLAIPAEPELFFMTGRVNPLRHIYLPFGIRTEETVAETIAILETNPPRIVFHVPALPYNSAHSNQIMDWVKANYVKLQTTREFDIYVAP